MPVVQDHPEAAAAVRRFHGVLKSQHDTLKAHLENMNDGEVHPHETIRPVTSRPRSANTNSGRKYASYPAWFGAAEGNWRQILE